MNLADLHANQGAALAQDGIPLHYGDLKAEYRAALAHAVLMDRSHEGRLELRGGDRFSLMQRMSTNNLLNMAAHEGRPTIFTNPNGRIIDRVMVYNRDEAVLLLAEPGRAPALTQYLQRNIFFNDDVRLSDITPRTRLFALHGPDADAVMALLSPAAPAVTGLNALEIVVDEVPVYAVRRKPLSGSHWALVAPLDGAAALWTAITGRAEPLGLALAGSLTYNTLRIRAGRPGVGRELSQDYIPLEAGLWDEVSFNKGCYTGQEIIARMESRGRLAKMLVTLRLQAPVEAPAAIYDEAGRTVGTLTSSVTTPEDEHQDKHLGLAFVKVALASPGQPVTVGEDRAPASVTAPAGTPPPYTPA